ncbi:hypothetical protein JMUB5695_00818 [Mycobacterium heckeshornense]|nr:hypothetical protein JMUB5695_00818 [Mycobacterium heckeshornense]
MADFPLASKRLTDQQRVSRRFGTHGPLCQPRHAAAGTTALRWSGSLTVMSATRWVIPTHIRSTVPEGLSVVT